MYVSKEQKHWVSVASQRLLESSILDGFDSLVEHPEVFAAIKNEIECRVGYRSTF